MHSSHLQKCLGILLGAALLVSCFSASAFALSAEIELSSAEVSPGDIVEGSIYIVNAGSDNNLMSYQFSLVSNAPEGEDLELTVTETDYLKLGEGFGNIARDGIAASSGDGYTTIDSEKQRIAGFTMKVPENPQLSAYTVSLYTDDGCSFVDTASSHYNEKQTQPYRTMNTETYTPLELDCEDLAVTPGQITVAGVTPSVSAAPQVNPTPVMSVKTEQEIISLGSDPHPTRTQAPAAVFSSSAQQQSAKTPSSSGSSSSGQTSQSVSQNSGSQQTAANPTVANTQDSKPASGSSQAPEQTTPVASPGFGIVTGLGLLGGVLLCLNRRNMS